MTHLLDTNVCIAVLRANSQVCQRLRELLPTDCGISTVSLFELYSGVYRCRQPTDELRKVNAFAAPLHLLPFDDAAAAHAARVRWELERKGEIIGPYDLMLAAQALALDVILVTHNTREFQRVEGLKWEDWQV